MTTNIPINIFYLFSLYQDYLNKINKICLHDKDFSQPLEFEELEAIAKNLNSTLENFLAKDLTKSQIKTSLARFIYVPYIFTKFLSKYLKFDLSNKDVKVIKKLVAQYQATNNDQKFYPKIKDIIDQKTLTQPKTPS